ncbi:MAG: lactate racemase domain-containing protein [Anaerolineae bacterium]
MNLLKQIQTLDFPAELPASLLQVRQAFDDAHLPDVPAAVSAAWAGSGLLARIRPGQRVAVGVGSRGITNLAEIVQTTVTLLRAQGAEPFITPAMGSHAGATADGQRQMLANLGITPQSVGAPVQATMAVREIGRLPDGPSLFQDELSAAADHTLLINRVKPHTSFRSHIESGLAKMAVVGLGKQRGAAALHSQGTRFLREALAPAARIYQERTNLLGGLALVENGRHQTAAVVALSAAQIGGPDEAALLEQAAALMPGLPFDQVDVLVVRQLGKNISGTGMDTNVIGRVKIPRVPESFGGPDVAVIAVLSLTQQTHGNANGIGLANVTTARVAAQIDWQATYTNTISSGPLGMWRASLPLTLPNDRQALSVALRGCGVSPADARWVFIEDTLNLERLWVSPALLPLVKSHPRLTGEGEIPLKFDEFGAMRQPWPLD